MKPFEDGGLAGDPFSSLEDVVVLAKSCREPRARVVVEMLGLPFFFGDVDALAGLAPDFVAIFETLTAAEREDPLRLRGAQARRRRGEIARRSGAALASLDRLLEIYAGLRPPEGGAP